MFTNQHKHISHWRNTKYVTGRAAKKTISKASVRKWNKAARRINSAETKWYNLNTLHSPNSVTVAVIVVKTNTSAGTTPITRLGDLIIAKSFEAKGIVSFLDDTLVNQTVLVMFFIDTQQAGIIPVTDSSIDANLGVLQDPDVNSVLSLEANRRRFKVIFSRRFNFTRGDGTQDTRIFYFKKNFRDMKIEYNLPTNVAAALGKNNIYILTLVDGAATTTSSTVKVYSRLRYVDL